MPSVSLPAPTEFIHLAPEIVLSLLGLFVLMYDVVALRGRPSSVRCRVLGVVSILGALVALAATFAPDFFDIRSGSDTHFDLRAHAAVQSGLAEEALFQGTILGSQLVDRLNALLCVLLVFVLGLSMTWEFTEHWGDYYAHPLGRCWDDAADRLRGIAHALHRPRDDDDLPLLDHGIREDQTPLRGGGAEVLRLRLSVVRALPLRPEPALRPDGTTSISGIGVALSSRNGQPGLEQASPGRWPCCRAGRLGFKIAAVLFHQ